MPTAEEREKPAPFTPEMKAFLAAMPNKDDLAVTRDSLLAQLNKDLEVPRQFLEEAAEEIKAMSAGLAYNDVKKRYLVGVPKDSVTIVEP